jgi:opacity protein-like surface antigen
LLATRTRPPGSKAVMSRQLLKVSVLLLALQGTVGPAAAEEDGPRPYFGFRLGAQWATTGNFASGVQGTTLQDIYGVTLGVDLTPHLGVELLGDWFQPTLKHNGRSIGEYGIATLMPQGRLRFPILDGQLVPYVVGGLGASRAEFNDRKPGGFGLSVHGSDWGFTAAAGVGAEWFVASNIAIGAEVRYVHFAGHEFEIGGRTQGLNLDSLVTTVTARLYFDGPPRPTADPAPSMAGPFYVGARVGGARTLHRRQIRSGIDAPTSISGAGGFDQLFGFDIGVDVTPHLGVEISAEGWDPDLSSPGVGRFGEYGIYSFLPQLRFRVPMLDGRLVPFALAGVGLGFAESKDGKPPASRIMKEAKDYSWEAGIGVGIEYFVVRNITVGVQGKYVYNRDHSFRLNGTDEKVNLDALLLSTGIKVYFP